MSTPSNQSGQGKPFTAGFELQTKIRVIIQQVLAATVRKLSQFNEKVESFEDFFMTFKQRINNIQEKSTLNDTSIQKLRQMMMKNKGESDSQLIKLEERFEKGRIENNEIKSELIDNQKKFATISRQHEVMNNEFSKTKAKFLQFSDQLITTKDEVSWKITKYVEETAAANTQIKLNHEQIKQDYFNMKLSVEKSVEKYDQVISLKDKQENKEEKYQSNFTELFSLISSKDEKIKVLNKKLEDMDTALYSKMKQSEIKVQKKIQELSESNSKIAKSVKKVDEFSKLIETIKEEEEQNKRQILKKIEEMDQRFENNLDSKVLDINRSILQSDKAVQKKLKGVTESQQKFVDFFNQKIQFLKLEIETELSSKATAMLEEKSKTQQGEASSVLDTLKEKVNKINMDTMKSINKVETNMKDMKREVDHKLEDFKQGIEIRVEKVVGAFESSSGSGVSPQFMKTLNERFQKVTDDVDFKIFNMNKDIGEQNVKIMGLQKMKGQTLTSLENFEKQNVEKFTNLQSKTAEKVQKLMFLVTKMRGDNIIRNEFTDKAIRQLKKFNDESANNIGLVFKLVPAFGEVLNIIMCLIYDAQFQHSKVINDLPGSKETQKFQNILEGVLYEFKENKKPGNIYYRHKQLKKTDIVKATFHAYTSVWEQIFEHETQLHSELVPKIFFKQRIQKLIGVKLSNTKTGITARGQKGSMNAIKNQSYSRQKIGGLSSNFNSDKDSSQNMNKSFQIRKKKTATVKSKQEILIVNDERR